MGRQNRRAYPDLLAYFRGSGDTQAAFAMRLKRSQSYISKVVNRHIEPSLTDALAIAREANVPLESLLRTTDDVSVS